MPYLPHPLGLFLGLLQGLLPATFCGWTCYLLSLPQTLPLEAAFAIVKKILIHYEALKHLNKSKSGE